MAQRRNKKEMNKLSGPAAQYPEVAALLRPIVAFLLRSGIPDAQLAREFNAALQGARRSTKKIDIKRIGMTNCSSNWCATIVDRWLRDPAYLNAIGKPKDIPLLGRNSIAALTKIAGASTRPKDAARFLEEFGAVRKTSKGTYNLVKRYMNYTTSETLLYEPNLEFLIDAVAVTARGLGKKKPSRPLFWLSSQYPALPRRHVAAFLAYIRQRGVVFLHEVDDWLEQHADAQAASKSVSNKFSRVGIGLFPICADK